jgi:hypothetical protein
MNAENTDRPFNAEVKDLRGRRFDRLLVIEFAGIDPRGYAKWRCLCDCGKETVKQGTHMMRGNTRSCGCLVSETARAKVLTHGKTKTTEFRIWTGMIDRATNPNGAAWKCYGGRGITVCERWKSFENFFSDMGPRPSSEFSLDRIDVNGNYCPENCRWANRATQARNRRSTIYLEFDGKKMSLPEWSEASGISCQTIRYRLLRHWSVERALTTPSLQQKAHSGYSQVGSQTIANQ